ncbi:efflux RND transporter periplasmic adaptor subunit [Xanthobacter sp. VTT E-85241]|uniref:efflux RND transporter periplasmic adaptor subunit n=1 Tax=Roseixanthobacter finlandensis TaxID=3119922 RepID=UPI00372BD27E
MITISSQSVPFELTLPGRVVASATAEIRPQVNGIVRRIAFQEGKKIATGDVLYELDNTKFKAAVAAASAALDKTQAVAVAAQATFGRVNTLAKSNAVSAQALDDARSTLLQAQADVEVARADLDTANINLDDATLTAPLDGEIGVSAVSIGALVTENQTEPLVTIRQIDPVYVDLVDSSVNLLRVRDEIEAGRLGREQAPRPVTLTLENGKQYNTTGTIAVVDRVVSQTAGTFRVRATFRNPDQVLVPGMFVRTQLSLGEIPDAYLVPQRAVMRGTNGEATVYVASTGGKAELRTVTTNGTTGNNWIVVGGLKDGDRIVVDGFQKISDGTAIEAVDASVDENGLVRQTLGSAAATTQEAPQ